MSGEYPPPITIRDNCAVPEWTHNQAEPDSEAVALAHVACSTISVVCCAFVLLVSNRVDELRRCLLYTSPSPRDRQKSRMPSSA